MGFKEKLIPGKCVHQPKEKLDKYRHRQDHVTVAHAVYGTTR